MRNGKVELENGAAVPDGASVIVLFEPKSQERIRFAWPHEFIERFSGSIPDFDFEEPAELPFEEREPLY